MGKKLLIGMSFLLNLIVFGVLGVVVVGNTLQPEMIPLLNQSITADEQCQLTAPFMEQEQNFPSSENRIVAPPRDRRQLSTNLDNTLTPPEDSITTHIDFTDDFESHFVKILDSPYKLPQELKLQNPQTFLSPNKRYSARMQKTDGSVVPCDQAKAALEFTRFDGPKRYLLIEDFRTIKLNWINDRLAHLSSSLR